MKIAGAGAARYTTKGAALRPLTRPWQGEAVSRGGAEREGGGAERLRTGGAHPLQGRTAAHRLKAFHPDGCAPHSAPLFLLRASA